MYKDFSLRRHVRRLANVDKRAIPDALSAPSLPTIQLPTIDPEDPLGLHHTSSTSSSSTHTRSVVTVTTVVLKSVATPTPTPPIAVTPTSAFSLSSLSSSSSSSSPSSSSSSTRSSTISSTSSSSIVVPTSSASRAVAPIVTSSASIAGAAASPSSSDVAATGTSTGAVAGIAVGIIGGILLLVGVVFYLIRRKRQNSEALSDDYFNAGRFRRQSVALVDDVPSPMYGSTGGVNPRPPTMVERHSTNFAGFGAARNLTPEHSAPMPPSKEQGYGYNQYGNVHPAMYNAQPSFAPGAIVPQQQYQNVYYNPPTQSPIGSPTPVSPYPSAYDETGRLIRSPSTAKGPGPANETFNSQALSRSVGSRSMNDSVDEDADTTMGGYANMSRVSVTPFQAAQYEAISKQLNVPPPLPRMSIVGPQAERSMANADDLDMSRETESPFADPDTSVRTGDEEVATIKDTRVDNESGFDSRRNSGASVELPLPPVPIAESPQSRITSIPPVLPEILLQQRPFSPVDSYHFSSTGSVTSSPVVSTFAASERSPMGSSFVGTLGHSSDSNNNSNNVTPISSTFDRSALEQTFPVSAQASPSSTSFNFAGGVGGASVPPKPMLLPVPPKPALTRTLGTSPVGQSALRNEVSMSREVEDGRSGVGAVTSYSSEPSLSPSSSTSSVPVIATASKVAIGKKKEQPAFRPESMYDDEDAYGGM